MLAVEDRFMIKDLYRKGVSISEIARRTGHDRKTVRKIATGPVVPTRAFGNGYGYRMSLNTSIRTGTRSWHMPLR